MYNLDDVMSSRTTKASDVWAFGMTVLEVRPQIAPSSYL